MIFLFKKELYSKYALIMAAYRFTDIAYIHLDVDKENYIVDLHLKDDSYSINEEEFKNTLLAEMVRLNISARTKNVRELILARAFSSTIIENEETEKPVENNFDINSILTDWFEDNDKT